MALPRRRQRTVRPNGVLAASALPFLRHARVLGLSPAAAGAHEELDPVDDGGMKVRVEATVRVHLRVAHVVSVGGGLAADRAGAWHRGELLRGTDGQCYSRAHR